jgi:PAS domain S-box-containing protein
MYGENKEITMTGGKVYRLALENMKEAVFVRDHNASILYMNPTAEKLSGWSFKETRGKKCYEIFRISPGPCKGNCPMEKIINGEQDIPFRESQIKTRSGEERQILYSISPLYKGKRLKGGIIVMKDITPGENLIQGEIPPLVALHNEISQRRTAEEALKQTNLALVQERQMFLSGPVVIFKWKNSEGWPVIYVSPNVKDVLGYTDQEFLSNAVSYTGIIPHEDIGRVSKEVFISSQKSADSFEHDPYRIIRKDGKIVWVSDHTTILRDEKGNITHFLGYLVNITEQKQAQLALQESENLLNDVFESIQDGISVLDTDLTVLRLNSVMKNWYRSKQPLEGKKCHECFHDSPVPCDPCPAIRSIKSGTVEREIFPGLPGSPIEWIELFSYPIRDPHSGKVTGIVELKRDITRRRQAEEERLKLEAKIQQAQKFESLNIMAGSIAHNFNNLLMMVLGNLELAQWGTSESDKDNEFLINAKKAVKRAADLSALMLTYVGQSSTNLKVINLSQSLNEIAGMLEMITGKKAKLTIKPVNKTLLVRSDQDQFHQAVVNLVCNAAEAIEDTQGEVSITTGIMFCHESFLRKTISGEGLQEGDYVFIEVSDNGCGIGDEIKQKIFDPFFTTKETGRGLGLSTVLGIVRGSKGAISVDTRSTGPHKGTTIRVLFPNLEVTTEEPGEKQMRKTPESPITGTVLLVDEDDVVNELGKDMLEELGFHVKTALTGRQAIETFAAAPFGISCVMIDMNLPDISFDHVLTDIKRIRSDIPVFVTSGYLDENMKLLVKNMAISGFIQKPYTLAQLNAGIKKALAENT